MALPVASFRFTLSGLSVQFTDSSANVPTSWNWAFGDGNTSTAQHPSHTYSAEGVYNLVLTVQNADGSDTEVSQLIVSLKPSLHQTIAQMVKCELSTLIDVDTDCFLTSVNKWQLYLQPLLPSKYRVQDADVFNEAKWPALVNVLISKLVVYDQVVKAMSVAVVALGNTSSTGTSGATGSGAVKYVETGPARVEWFNPADFWKAFFKSGQSATGNPSGILDAITTGICALGNRMRIKLPMCKLATRTPLFRVARKRGCRMGFCQATLGWVPGCTDPTDWGYLPYVQVLSFDFTATAGQTVFGHQDLVNLKDITIIVNGSILQTGYNYDQDTGDVTLTTPLSLGALVTIKGYK